MTKFGLRSVCALVATAACSCGPGSSSVGPVDAAADAASPTPVVDASEDAPSLVTTTCDNADLLAGCAAGSCMVTAARMPLAAGASITVTQRPVAADLAGDALGSFMCSIDLPAGASPVPNLDLRMTLVPGPDSGATLFQYVSSSLSRIVLTSQALSTAVEGLVTAPGTYGATERPGLWSLEAQVGINVSSAADQASLLRNLSSQAMYDAYYDGAQLFACNGPRLLVYEGIPTNPGVGPNLVVGQPDIDTLGTATSSSLFGKGVCTVPWSDGKRLVVVNYNRVLVWNAIPSTPLAPADLVLGQPDFSSNSYNSGGVSAITLQAPQSVDSDGTRLAVADTLNNRVLVWSTFPTRVDQPPDFVVGEPDFTSNGSTVGAAPLYQAWGVALTSTGMFVSSLLSTPFGLAHVSNLTVDNPLADFIALKSGYALVPDSTIVGASNVAVTPNGGLAVRDAYLQRVAMMRTVPTGPVSIDFVLGQPDALHVVENPVSASSLSIGMALGSGQEVMVPDGNRLLLFDTPPTYNFEPASRVIGQAGFTTNGQVDYRGISASTMAGPADVAAGGGVVAVADRGNNRVLLYRAGDVGTPSAGAAVILGQPDATSYVPDLDQRTPSAARMSGPAGIALDGTHLIVADTENHRVLIWSSVPTVTGAPADLVLGQADFTGRRPNRGRGDADGDGFSDADADGFFYPTGVASDGTHLFVADRLNNRVLGWSAFPTVNDQPADVVIGQPRMQSSQANFGNGPFTFVPQGLNLPTGVALAGSTLWVADTANNRIVRWDAATTNPAPADVFLGQSSGSSVTNAHYFLDTETAIGQPRGQVATTSISVLGPRGVAAVGGTLYVSEADSNRVHMFDTTSLAPLGELGQTADANGTPNTNGVGSASLSAPLGLAVSGGTLWVADSTNHRVLGYAAAATPPTGAPATIVLGQPGFLTNGFDQTSAAASGVTSQPAAVALAGGNLYVADTNNNRVLVMTTPVAPGQVPARLYGQPNSTLALPNAGGSPSAATLRGPRGVFADAARVIVADSGNNRVLVFDAGATGNAATLVLGQASFTSSAANAGGVTASTMQGPTAAYTDGASLWVSDTGNHRVLAWKTFPTANGQPADLVIGQTSLSGALPNQGTDAASATTLSFPSGIAVVRGALFIADTGNNRVLSFSTPPVASGAIADGVLGQPDLFERAAAAVGTDLTRLAGPTALAADGENLYVVDRDLGRVLAYQVGTLTTSAPALLDIGPATGVTLTAPQGIAVERTPFFTSRLYVADTGDSQVALVRSVSRLSPQ